MLDLRPAGGSALLATFDSLAAVIAFRAGLSASGLPGVTEVVSGARTLLFRFDPTVTDAGRVRAALAALVAVEPAVDAVDDAEAEPVVVPVTYDGEDLDDVARLAGLSTTELVAWHTGQVWTSAFCGFAPGFSYLTGTSPSLDLPRRASARTAVPSGAVALAGEFSAVYPRTSPGGWQLIGRTDAPMWSLDRDPPALAPSGTRVRFVAVDR
ncbi:allophanate hydrolase subunit 1 [Curtobacterium sp. VKM Ac-2922]|uniref:5-oxoprolinase subunit B family protein n=1 Tax=Curtobacterium sp. VKM Ac-2922 TaxID=2929475 RepID=UPI001FB3431A|nr:allophanate hydrolase subunit 1 [Curtobacterium sp. VKM Ac-2922]MCJ1714361.1 allophanate hydrolase subunit 1 [Curtobacterium sp. VKM Ac-2922]